MRRIAILTFAVVLSCAKSESVRINGAGSTFVYPLISKWAYEYSKVSNVQINYQSIGSGGGIKQVSAGTVDFGASDAPLTKDELDKRNLFQYPIIVGGVVPVFNIQGFEGKLKLSSDVVCDIFLGKIKKWNDERILKLNPDVKLPDLEIVVVHRADGSGTTWIWTNYLSKACPQWKEKVGYGKSVKWPVGIGAKGNEGIANYVKQTNGSIGYVEYAYAIQNNLNYALLQSADGQFVEPSIETFMNSAKYAKWSKGEHFYEVLTYKEGNSWPSTGATWVLIPRSDKEKAKVVNKFFKWAFENGDEYAKKLHYVPLPKEVKEKIYSYWKENGIEP